MYETDRIRFSIITKEQIELQNKEYSDGCLVGVEANQWVCESICDERCVGAYSAGEWLENEEDEDNKKVIRKIIKCLEILNLTES